MPVRVRYAFNKNRPKSVQPNATDNSGITDAGLTLSRAVTGTDPITFTDLAIVSIVQQLTQGPVDVTGLTDAGVVVRPALWGTDDLDMTDSVTTDVTGGTDPEWPTDQVERMQLGDIENIELFVNNGTALPRTLTFTVGT